MRTAYLLLAVAACSKHADAPAPAAQTADWAVVPLGADFSFPGAIKIPKGAKLTTQKGAGHVALADGTSVDFMQASPQRGAGNDYEMMKKVFGGSGNQILIDRHSPTGFAFAYTQAATGAIKVSGANWTVEPGISCGLGLDVQKPITREQAEVMVDICFSLQAAK